MDQQITGIDVFINQEKSEILANKFGLYNFTGYRFELRSKFSFKITPFENGQKYNTISIRFSESLNKHELLIKERYIYDGFGRGIRRFTQKLIDSGKGLSNCIKIEILEYECHPIDNKPLANEIFFDSVLDHIYNKTPLMEREKLEIIYEEYNTIYLEINSPSGVVFNENFVEWNLPEESCIQQIGLTYPGPFRNKDVKHFVGMNSLTYSNMIDSKAFKFEIGFNDKNEFIELSFDIGFVLKIKDWIINYCDPIESLINEGERRGYVFKKDKFGNYFCDELGLVLSESAYVGNKLGQGILEYLYITKPKNFAIDKGNSLFKNMFRTF